MPEVYRIVWDIDDAKAQAAFKRGAAGFSAMDKAAARTATGLEAIATRAGVAAGAAQEKQTAATAAGSARRVKVAKAEAQAIDVGWYKLVANTLKYQDQQTAAAARAAAARQKIFDKAQTDEHNRGVAAAKDAQRAAAQGVRDAERAASARQKIFDKAQTDEHNRGIAAAKDSQRAAAQKVRDAERASAARQKVFDKAQTDEHNRDLKAAKERQRLAEQVARARERAEEGPAGRAALYRRKALTDEQAHAVAVNRITDVANKRKIEAIAKQMGEQRLSFAEAIHSALGLEGALTKVGIAVAAIGAAKAAWGAFANAFRAARDNAESMARSAQEALKTVRAAASVQGITPDKAFSKQVAEFGVRTGMTLDEAARFQESFLGRAQIVRGKTISDQAGPGGAPSEFAKFMTTAGQVATAKNVPAEVMAELAGAVLKSEDFQKKGQGATEASARLLGALKILDAGSGNVPELARNLTQITAALTSESELEGVFRNVPEAAVAASVMAEYNPQEGAVFVRQASHALRDTGDKGKAEFFRRSKITPMDSFLEAVDKANRVIAEEVDKGVPVDTALEKFGFDAIREVTGLKTFFKARDTVLAPQKANLAAVTAAGYPAAAAGQVAELTRTDVFRGAQARADIEAAKQERGGLGTARQMAMDRAEAALIREGLDDSLKGQSMITAAGFATLGLVGGRKALIEQRALAEERKRAGAEGPGEFVIPPLPYGHYPFAAGPRGGTNRGTLGETLGDNRDVFDVLKAMADNIEEMNRRAKAAPPVPAVPPALPVGAPRGVPVRP